MGRPRRVVGRRGEARAGHTSYWKGTGEQSGDLGLLYVKGRLFQLVLRFIFPPCSVSPPARVVGERSGRPPPLVTSLFCVFMLQGQEDSSRGSDNSSYDEALSPTSPGPLSVRAGHGERDLGNPNTAPPIPELHGINPVFLSSNPSRWSVEEVYEFIASLQGIVGLSDRTQVTLRASFPCSFLSSFPCSFPPPGAFVTGLSRE